MPYSERQSGQPQLWNHRIHQRWAGEDLAFWRLAFFPTYDYTEIKHHLHEAMGTMGVRAYTIYETLGLFDLFIRAWLPSYTAPEFGQSITNALSGQSLQLCEQFTVNRILRHWAWDDGDGNLLEPTPEFLNDRWPGNKIASIDDGSATPAMRQTLEKAYALRPLPDDGSGIKFLIVISTSIYSMTHMARVRLESALLDVLDTYDIGEPSLYEGSGFGQFVLMGRVEPKRFFILPELAAKINAAGIQDTARPYTFVSSTEKPIFFDDRLSLVDDDGVEPFEVERLLTGGEDLYLEVKGSAWTSWARRLSGDGEEVKSQQVMNEGLVKSVVGMLNAEGGHIVVGALERSARFGRYVADEHPDLAEYPRLGEYICVGVEDEYGERGWDQFRLNLLDVLSKRIDPPPAGSINLARHTIEGRDLCVISIAPTKATWYYRYLEGAVDFFVRESGRTMLYAGSSADAYKRERPRG